MAQLALFESCQPKPKPEPDLYSSIKEFLDHWDDPCPCCGKKTRGVWSGYAMAEWKIYLCMECFNKHYQETKQ